tara:strand:- start:690 stop:1316 length:627 start_codon:yes stop_codon:yes gene_type:complete
MLDGLGGRLSLAISSFIKSHSTAYEGIVSRCMQGSKAKKDIVGEEYEAFRKGIIESIGLSVGDRRDISHLCNNSFNPDQVIVSSTGKLLALEEDKAHYVDKCFLSRAIINCARVVQKCLDSGNEVPYFVLSCPTTYGKFEEEFSEGVRLFREDIALEMKDKFKYFSFCDHDRVRKSNYLKEGIQPFQYNEKKIEREINFWNSLQSQGV